MLNDKSLAEYLLGTVVERMWHAQLNEVPHYHMSRSDARSLYELETMALASIQISGSWRGAVCCAADTLALDALAQKLLAMTAELTMTEKRAALLHASEFVYQYLSVAIGPDLIIRKPQLSDLRASPPAWLFGVSPIYDKCIRLGSGRFWITIVNINS